MEAKPIYVAAGLGGLVIGLILWDRYRSLKSGGGLVNEVGEVILGEPPQTEVGVTDSFPVTPDDLERLPVVPLGIWAVFQKPNWGEVVTRTSYFGSEIDLRFSLKNLNATPRKLDLALRVTEKDINADTPVTKFLQAVTIPGHSGIVLNGSYAIDTRAIITGRLDVTATLVANGEDLATTVFEVS